MPRVRRWTDEARHNTRLRVPDQVARGITARAAIENVSAGTTDEEVVTAVTDQRVIEIRAYQAFDRRIGVADGLARVATRGRQAYGHSLGRARVAGIVDAALAVHRVGAQSGVDPIAYAVSDQNVIEVATVDALDGNEDITCGLTRVAGRVAEAHSQADRGISVVCIIKAACTVERVGAQAAAQNVDGCAAVEGIVAAQSVVERAAPDTLDRIEGVAEGLARVAQRIGEINRHA